MRREEAKSTVTQTLLLVWKLLWKLPKAKRSSKKSRTQIKEIEYAEIIVFTSAEVNTK